MARQLRIEYPGAVYHFTSRGNTGKKIFSDYQDRGIFLWIYSDGTYHLSVLGDDIRNGK